MIWILLAVLFPAALAGLCGYTNIRFPAGRKEGKTHVACVGDSITNDAKPERMPVIAGSVRAVAEETGAELVDLYALTEEKRELFGPDGLHPSAEGARVIAEAVCERIRNSRVPDQAEPGNPEQGGYNH